MSRTKKGKKGAGFEYWGRRPLKFGDQGTKGKRDGIQRERAASKAKERKAKRDQDDS